MCKKKLKEKSEIMFFRAKGRISVVRALERGKQGVGLLIKKNGGLGKNAGN